MSNATAVNTQGHMAYIVAVGCFINLIVINIFSAGGYLVGCFVKAMDASKVRGALVVSI